MDKLRDFQIKRIMFPPKHVIKKISKGREHATSNLSQIWYSPFSSITFSMLKSNEEREREREREIERERERERDFLCIIK